MDGLSFGEQVKIILSRKNMTIKELIEQLEEFDEDTDIGVSWDGFTVDPIDHIDETEDFRAVIRPMEY